jgi:hypothetical protein
MNDINTKFKSGHLYLIDNLKGGDPDIAGAISSYSSYTDVARQARHWARVLIWMENIFFGLGRHYIDDILVSRLSRNSDSGEISRVRENTRKIPRPTNDLLGRYIETNIALLTENRPRPRVTSKSDRKADVDAATLSELTLDFLWEALKMPDKHRELARLMLYCGIGWLEVCYDPLKPKIISVAQPDEESQMMVPGPGGQPMSIPVDRYVDPTNDNKRNQSPKVEFGDLDARVVSPFEMHLPAIHDWFGDDLQWIMRESYVPIDYIKAKYGDSRLRGTVNKTNGYHLDNIDEIQATNTENLPLWWWERLTDVVEGPGPSLYVGTPETWADYTTVRILDRKPSDKWPKGRTVIIAGNKLIYDSPKDVGARAYDPKWPNRWHPYIRYRWEGIPGSIHGRSLVSKLLPKLKRVNAIDTTLIMWRRTVPIASWIMPKGTSVVEDLHSGKPGVYIEYDPRKTMQNEPKPVFPPAYPSAAIEERTTQIQEMEAIAGTEEILRGERPSGVTSAAMLDALRKQALASRSATLQEWDESLQETGTSLLQEVVKHVKNDPRYAERVRILAREKLSRVAVEKFSGTDLSDNVVVRVDTASMALVSREARQQRALEFLQYAPNFIQLPTILREKILDWLNFDADLKPQGPDINRCKNMIQWIKDGRFDLAIPFPEDDPYIFHELLVAQLKDEEYIDWRIESQKVLIQVIDYYKSQIILLERQRMAMEQQMQAQGSMMESAAAAGPPETQ